MLEFETLTMPPGNEPIRAAIVVVYRSAQTWRTPVAQACPRGGVIGRAVVLSVTFKQGFVMVLNKVHIQVICAPTHSESTRDDVID